MLCQFLLYNCMNQLQVCIYPLPLESPMPPALLVQVIAEHPAELPAPCNSFPSALYFTCGSVCVSVLLSELVPPSPSHSVSTSPFSTSQSLFLPCKQVPQYHFSRFHIYALRCNICFSLTYFILYDIHQVHPHHYKRPSLILFYG